MRYLNWGRIGVLFCLFSFIEIGCSQKTIDKETKADITTKAETDINFVGVKYTVADGIVTLSGNCSTEKAKSSVEGTVKEIAGVKNVVNTITIAPVTITADQPLKKSVDSVLKKYARVQADVTDSIVVVKGEVEQKEMQKLLEGLNSLQAKKVENQLVVR